MSHERSAPGKAATGSPRPPETRVGPVQAGRRTARKAKKKPTSYAAAAKPRIAHPMVLRRWQAAACRGSTGQGALRAPHCIAAKSRISRPAIRETRACGRRAR